MAQIQHLKHTVVSQVNRIQLGVCQSQFSQGIQLAEVNRRDHEVIDTQRGDIGSVGYINSHGSIALLPAHIGIYGGGLRGCHEGFQCLGSEVHPESDRVLLAGTVQADGEGYRALVGGEGHDLRGLSVIRLRLNHKRLSEEVRHGESCIAELDCHAVRVCLFQGNNTRLNVEVEVRIVKHDEGIGSVHRDSIHDGVGQETITQHTLAEVDGRPLFVGGFHREAPLRILVVLPYLRVQRQGSKVHTVVLEIYKGKIVLVRQVNMRQIVIACQQRYQACRVVRRRMIKLQISQGITGTIQAI